MKPQIWLVLDTELPLSPTRTTSDISHTHSHPFGMTSARTWQPGMRLDAVTSRSTRLGFVDSGGWQWLTVGGTSRKLCTDRCMTMCIGKLLRLHEELRNLSQISLRKYVVITKNVAESLGLQREVPRMWSTSALFSYCIISSYLPSASHRYRIQFRFIANRSSQAPLKVNTLEKSIIHSLLVRVPTCEVFHKGLSSLCCGKYLKGSDLFHRIVWLCYIFISRYAKESISCTGTGATGSADAFWVF